jgi:hypothetical protein
MRFPSGDRRLGWQIMSKRSDSGGGDPGGERYKGDGAQLPRGPSASLENLKLADTQRQRVPGSDPYNSAPVPTIPARRHTQRALDDMPAAAAVAQPALTPASDLALKLAGMRVDLERVLSDMEALRASTVDSANRKAVGLMLQLGLAARHLEDAIDSLLPQDEP